MEKPWQAMLKCRSFSICPRMYYLLEQSKKPLQICGPSLMEESTIFIHEIAEMQPDHSRYQQALSDIKISQSWL